MEIWVWHSEEEIWAKVLLDPYPRTQGLEAMSTKMEFHETKTTIKREEHVN